MLRWIGSNILTLGATFALLGFMSGVVLRSLYYVAPSTSVFLVSVAAIFISAFWIARRKVYLLVALSLAGCFLGVVRTETSLPHLADTYGWMLGTNQSIEGKVIALPDVRESAQRITVQTNDGQRVLVVAPLYPKVEFGSLVRAEGNLERPEPFDTETGRVFRYDNFLAKDRVYLVLNDASIEKQSEDEASIIAPVAYLFRVRADLTKGIESALVEPNASLAIGMLLGGKQGLGEELLDAFIITGLVHIVVLSGYNITVVAEAILRALSFLGRRKSAITAGFAIILFVLVAGAGAASVRAGIMACIAVFARATHRTYDALRALALAVFVMVSISPLTLVYDPGFQLSVIATLGLILLSSKIEPAFLWVQISGLRDVVVATVTAQISVLPLLLYMTGQVSWTTLPANILVLPFVPLAMLLSFVAGLIGVLLPSVAHILALPAHVVLTYITTVAQFLSGIPASQGTIPAHPIWVTVLLYTVMIGLFYRKGMTTFLYKFFK